MLLGDLCVNDHSWIFEELLFIQNSTFVLSNPLLAVSDNLLHSSHIAIAIYYLCNFGIWVNWICKRIIKLEWAMYRKHLCFSYVVMCVSSVIGRLLTFLLWTFDLLIMLASSVSSSHLSVWRKNISFCFSCKYVGDHW